MACNVKWHVVPFAITIDLNFNMSPLAVISILVIVPGIEVSRDELPFLLMPKLPA